MTVCTGFVRGEPCEFPAKHSDGRCGFHTTEPKTKAERQRRRRARQNELFVKHARPMNVTSVMRMPLAHYLQLALVAEALEEA